jgi:ribonuclease HII
MTAVETSTKQMSEHCDANSEIAQPIICGLDEVGRGALAGPLVAVGAILPPDFTHLLLRDSKLLSNSQRERAFAAMRDVASFREVWIGARTIDTLGIQRANQLAFETLIENISADIYLVDGNLTLRTSRPYISVPHGESLHPQIAAASILAKVIRDRHMALLAALHPNYGWEKNRGYGTAFHVKAITRLGITPEHRLTFKPNADHLTIA